MYKKVQVRLECQIRAKWKKDNSELKGTQTSLYVYVSGMK